MNRLKDKWLLVPAFLIMYVILYLIDATCVIKAIVGFECPGCGMTRAVISLLKLDFSTAFEYHPMVFSLPILFAYIILDGVPFKNRILNISVISAVGVGFLVVWILRLI